MKAINEPCGADLLVKRYGDVVGVALAVRLARARQRVIARISRDVRERGKVCAACSERHTPKRADQQRCPPCIQGRCGYAVPF